MRLDCEVVVTRTGAKAVRDRVTGELMHPVVGPLVESERLYALPARLAERLRDPGPPLVLFDVGLGAGSNAVAALRVSESLPVTARRLAITSFDRSPAALALALEDAHAPAFGLGGETGRLARALLASGRVETPRTVWTYVEGDVLETLPASTSRADVTFWDPFSPGKNPDLWSVRAFAAAFSRCGPEGTLFTYSGATRVRAALLLAGFAVGVGQPIGDGRAATEAAVDAGALSRPLDTRWLARLLRSSAPFPADAPPDAADRIAGLRQFRVPPG